MINNYSNVYRIEIDDYSDQVDHKVHGLIKQWVG